ncbi:hypothetical protein [Cyanobacterium sp. Dongsha4]|uniref:hypothetical protein n=1 Tax=Cyanobacterium sp. DS4 TaxID=2878255 RepID=UPI002E80F734|nr:hypothetical protein [Cyanobacterium sp. Dongsha4]WVK99756.1 hypothetical protein Dongsha4_13890 [Cyanobacterium sp. Dongsha4]
MQICKTCKGSGVKLVKTSTPTYKGVVEYYPEKCLDCNGKGYILSSPSSTKCLTVNH